MEAPISPGRRMLLKAYATCPTMGRHFKFTEVTFDTDHSSAALLGNPTFGYATRSYTNFQETAIETGMSTLSAGIHWTFDIETGFTVGDRVALNALNEFAKYPSRRRSCHSALDWLALLFYPP